MKKNCALLSAALPCPHQTAIIKYEDGKEQKTTIFYNALPVKLPGSDYPLVLVVVKGFGKQPMMLLTNCAVQFKSKENVWRIVEIYLTRWKCDESFRYIKQCYNMEDVRVRSYISIQNTVALVLAVAYFASVYLGDNLRLKMLVERVYIVSKRFFGVPTFFNYAIADGLYNLLFTDKTGVDNAPKTKKPEFQLTFTFGKRADRPFLINNSHITLLYLDIYHEVWLPMDRGSEMSFPIPRTRPSPISRPHGRPGTGRRTAMPGHHHAPCRLLAEQVMKTVELSDSAVRRIIRAFNFYGVDGLIAKKRSGRTPLLGVSRRKSSRRVRGAGTRPEDILDGVCLPRAYHKEVRPLECSYKSSCAFFMRKGIEKLGKLQNFFMSVIFLGYFGGRWGRGVCDGGLPAPPLPTYRGGNGRAGIDVTGRPLLDPACPELNCCPKTSLAGV